MIVQTTMEGAKELVRGLAAVEQVLKQGGVTRLGRRLTRETVRLLGILTPRQRNTQRAASTRRMSSGTPPLAKRWERVEQVLSEFRYQAIVRNKASLTPDGAVILAALEYGARPHSIPGTGRTLMIWDQPSAFRLFRFRASSDALGGGRDVTDVFSRRRQAPGVVVTEKVRHPGHRAFRMVQEAHRQVVVLSDTMLANFQRDIRQAFASGFQVTVARV